MGPRTATCTQDTTMANPLRVSDLAGVTPAKESGARKALLSRLDGAEPTAPDALFSAVKDEVGVSESVVRQIAWDLVSQGKLEFTKDWRLKLVG